MKPLTSFLLALLLIAFATQAEAHPKGTTMEAWEEAKSASPSGFVIRGKGYSITSEVKKSEAIVILYTHGSRGDEKPDTCKTERYRSMFQQASGNTYYPRVFDVLAERDERISVFYVCHEETGKVFRTTDGKKITSSRRFELDRKIPCVQGTINGKTDLGGLSKVCKRAQKIRKEIRKIKAHNMELKDSNIFISGGSAGAWASLLLKAHHPDIAKGVIAFAPATHGEIWRRFKFYRPTLPERLAYIEKAACTNNRYQWKDEHTTVPEPAKWKWKNYIRHRCQQKFIAEHISTTLMFAYSGDPFNDPALLPDFQAIPSKIEFHKVPLSGPLWKGCGIRFFSTSYPHACHQSKRFAAFHADTIYQFIMRHAQ